MKKKNSIIRTVITIIAFTLSVLFFTLILWISSSYSDLKMDQVIFHLFVPLDGTDSELIVSALFKVIVPTLLMLLLSSLVLKIFLTGNFKYTFSLQFFSKKFSNIVSISYPFFISFFSIISLLLFSSAVLIMDSQFDLKGYIKAQFSDSSFIKDHYVFSENKLSFPEKKRNLVYIYLESMENTYSSIEKGGGFEENYIPELTELAEENVSFSNTEKLGGNSRAVGTGWTMAAMFSHSTGLPLKLPIEGNSMSEYSSFFPGVETIGEVLKENSYSNYLMVGSDAAFGGRRLFYEQHGDYEIYDYNWAKTENMIPEDYKVWWGFEDRKLFKFAKAELSRISQESEPFNFTMLTVDTHHEDGYLSDQCDQIYSEQYANVIACSSKQVYDFVEWLKEQSFYSNTTIVIVGDHHTMDSDFNDNLPEGYKRTLYNTFINVPFDVTPYKTNDRIFTSYDYYPTTLASLGVNIKGNRLGLGTNLFSEEKTLIEKYGSQMMEELDKKSRFYDEKFIY